MLTVYSKDNCPQCAQVISLATMRGVEHKVLKLDVDFTREQLLDKVEQSGGPAPRQFPVLFHDDAYLGGGLEPFRSALLEGRF